MTLITEALPRLTAPLWNVLEKVGYVQGVKDGAVWASVVLIVLYLLTHRNSPPS